ncbi:hypothetical protein PPL_06402 [Heterostelium album PN500]|uniref:G-protein coupled receptors family 2 profile 2 domain-containing protein n=1 Tax=Heterostelium pallidum (strain ATCC 26659 / Pp 5 / PN500) TaxID=670386 RepID=D3BD22_HETP5|nr:hypothetical protein PPL_06402 [Heterostelium album PN500]EFA80814.1 hypothetical protein PPL_06402 [Heterostelium album PN500]|eukprot:XP_020432933.1 hypothetical protein PPL_06402 [Heterostelium album PN500]
MFTPIVHILMLISSFFSILTTITYVIFKKHRTFQLKLIVYLCYSLCIQYLFVVLSFSFKAGSEVCIGNSIVHHYFYLNVILWNTCVAFNFYQVFIKNNKDAENYEIYYHLIVYGIPFIDCLFNAIKRNYGVVSDHCSIVGDLWYILGLYVPGLICFVVNMTIYIVLSFKIGYILKNTPATYRKDKSKELKVHLSIFVSTGILGFVSFLITFIAYFSKNSILYWFFYNLCLPLEVEEVGLFILLL